jgi:uncharacterized protein (TIGR02246 family)
MNKHTVVGLVLSVAATSIFAQSSADEAAIQRLVVTLNDAWDRGDATAMAAHFQPDGTFTNVNGSVFYGRDEFRERHRQIFENAFKGSTATMTIRRMHFMRSDVALVDVNCTVSGGALPSVESRLLLVLGKSNDEWSIAAYHNVDVKPVPIVP